jgi:hypothetical protein
MGDQSRDASMILPDGIGIVRPSVLLKSAVTQTSSSSQVDRRQVHPSQRVGQILIAKPGLRLINARTSDTAPI